jgi:hypothetical protein
MLSRSGCKQAIKNFAWQASDLRCCAVFLQCRQIRFLTKPEFKEMPPKRYVEKRNSLF